MTENNGQPEPRQRLPLRRYFDDAYLAADRLLDRSQARAFRLLWLFLPETSIARDVRFQQILASRFLSDAGQQALAYGALIVVARSGGSAVDLAVVGLASLLPAATLGLYGGAVADELPKRVALSVAYNLQALLCFLVPLFAGTDLVAIFVLIFAVNALGQVSGPSESSVLPLVATTEQLASAASLMHFASSLGTGFGTALLAPLLVRVLNDEAVMYVAGALLILAGTRVFDLPTSEVRPAFRWRPPEISVIATVRWLAQQPAVMTMVVVAVLSGTANVVLQTLAPRYVVAALHVDAANAVYVFAASSVGLGAALIAAPLLMKRIGERLSSLAGFALTCTTLVLLGLVEEISPAIDEVNPIRLAQFIGADLNGPLRTAALIAVPLGFGVSLTTTSVQTYINRRVPLDYQGRAFALQGALKNGVAIIPLFTLAGAAAAFGVEPVLVAAPLMLLVMAYALVQLSIRFAGLAPPSNLEVFQSFWEEGASVQDIAKATEEEGPEGRA